MFVYKNINTGKFIVSQNKIDDPDMTFLREAKEVHINSEEIHCNIYFISDNNQKNDILLIT
jgi:hypothetical protein